MAIAAATARDAGLRPVLDVLQRDGDGVLPPATLADLAAGAARLERARCNVVVLGAFKRGKSTLLNALLGRDVLPTGVVPLTSAPTVLRHGDAERLLVRLGDERVEEHPLAALPDFVTEPRNPGNARGVATVEVELRHPLLAGGLQLVDTPGIASIHRHNTRAAQDVLGRVDAALCVMSADQPLAEQEADLYRAAAERAGRMLYALTKVDRLSGDELEQAVAYVANALRAHGLLDSDAQPLAVSAVDGRGIAELRDRLQALSGGARDRVVARAVARTARAAATELVRRCDLERRALELPLAELDARAGVLEGRLAELQAAHADANDLLQRRVGRMLDERVNAPLLEYARAHDAGVQRALEAYTGGLAERSTRATAAALDAWIDDTVRTVFAGLAEQYRATVADGLSEVAAGHSRRIDRLLADVQQAAADALGGSAPQVPAMALAEPVGFGFKLHDPEHGLEIIVGGARRAVPGALGRRLALADARERLRAMTDRHAGRLRAELVTRAREALGEHRRRLDAAMDEACAAVRGAIERARHERARGGDAARARLDDLAGRRARASAAERRLAAIAAGPE